MALSVGDLKSWARDNAVPENEENPEEGESESERNPIWAGEEDVTEETDEGALDEFFQWMEENEPELWKALVRFAHSVEVEDPRMEEEARRELAEATQYLNPEYPPMGNEAREMAGDKIAEHMRAKNNPVKGSRDWKQAVAMGLSEARKKTEPEDEG